MKKIIIKPNISCRTYNFECENSRTYIIDEQLHYQYLLEGISSDMWYKILTCRNYDDVYNYALEHKVEKDINEFLIELDACNLILWTNTGINTDGNSNQLSYTAMAAQKDDLFSCNNFENETVFDEEKTVWLYKKGFLENLILQLSYKCNLQCKHCFNDKDNENYEISFEAAKKIIDEAYEMGITTVGITGGECTFSSHFLDIIKYIRQKHISLAFNTNGQKLYDDKDLFDNLVSLYPNKLKISLYSMTPDIHDSITGVKGSCKKTIDVIKRLREKNVMVEINHLVFLLNQGEYSEVNKFAKEVRARFNYNSYFISNPVNNNGDLRLKDRNLVDLYLNKEYPASVYNTITKQRVFKKGNRTICRASEFVLAVSPKLDVMPCNDFKYILGNLHTNSLREIWTTQAVEFRKKFLKSKLTECFQEDYCKYCFYCAVHAIYENGFMKKSIGSCENAKAYHEALKISRLSEKKDI